MSIEPEDPIRAFRRKAIAERRTAGQVCKCGESRPGALIAGSNPSPCAKCQRLRRGQSTFDAHHPAGEVNHPATVLIPVNDHRAILSDQQYDWPTKTWENPGGTPLLAGAASIRGYYDTNSYLTDQLLIRVAKILETLDEVLPRLLGSTWWVGTELEQYALKPRSKKCPTRPRR